ncbi:MAG: AbrB/MazE/SpoVT family DNA-binding domain-containing protein [Nitrospirae bacterium]|nr:AbrB/MazE/SpoVT family DNA-binding domain-containing protein [Nitrospirota bacterium]
MRAKAQKWGNSLAVRIPKVIADEASIHENDELNIDVVDRQIRIIPCQRPYDLNKLLAGISEENLHKEIDLGTPAGQEIL